MKTLFSGEMIFYKLFWIYLIGAFLGVVIETLWCILKLRKIESRKGLIYEPLNPVYGFGALVMTLSLISLRDERDLSVFVLGAVIGGVYEYLCSFFQEKFLGSVSWDYKKYPLNLNGRINLLYCFFWGILALLWVKDVLPEISWLIGLIPKTFFVPLTYVMFFLSLADILISTLAVRRMCERKSGIKAKNRLFEIIDKAYPDEKLKKVYPNMLFLIIDKKTVTKE